MKAAGAPLLLLLAGCYVAPPGIEPEQLARYEKLEEGRIRLHWVQGNLEKGEVEPLLPELASVAQAVSARFGCAPPPVSVVVWDPPGVAGAGSEPVLATHGYLREGRVVFRYAWDPDEGGLVPLLGTSAHEMAEAAVLSRVTAIDPYLRWLHDGLAELAEHEVLLARDPAHARAELERTLRFLAEQRQLGVRWIDLGRWRQLSPWVVRSFRFLDDPGNLSLLDIPASQARVQSALKNVGSAELRKRGLLELVEVLSMAAEIAARPFEPDEARPDDPQARDLLFYVASLAAWLHLERQAPGAARRAVAELERRRRVDEDHVFRAREAPELLRVAAPGVEPLALQDLPLEAVERVLAQEVERLKP